MKTTYLSKKLALLLAFSFIFSSHSSLNATGQGNCADGQIKIESDPFTYTDPQALPISLVWIKAGSAQSTDGNQCIEFNQDSDNGCYLITGIGTSTVTAQKIGEGPDCKDISHIEIILAQTEITPILTDTPTPTSSSIPTSTSTPTVTPQNTPQTSPTSTLVPTSTQSPQPTSTPTSGSVGGGENTTSDHNTSSSVETNTTGQVLGVSTMAHTGIWTDIAQHLTNLVGFTYLTNKFKKNAQKQKKNR